jgi:uncharacterized protein (TIGR03790 family)
MPLFEPYRAMKLLPILCVLLIAYAAPGPGAEEELPSSTLVVYNPNYPESKSLAEYYAGRRAIPKDRVVVLPCSNDEEINRSEYDRAIATPLRKYFQEAQLWTVDQTAEPRVTSNKIRYIVLIRGIPLKIRFQAAYPGDNPDRSNPFGASNQKAVDSELSTLGYFRRQISGPMANPYYRSFKPITDPDSDPRLMLVARLDGPGAGDVRRMIDDSLAAESTGLYGWTYLDARGTEDPNYKIGDEWLFHIADESFRIGRPSILDRRETLFPIGYPMTDAVLYFGWYAKQTAGVLSDPQFRFRPGAIAVHIFSFSASTIRRPDKSWVGSLIRQGAAASLGNVYEPYLPLTPRLDLFYDRLVNGLTFAESAYASLRAVSWMTTIVGDPLYRPFSPEQTSGDPSWQAIRELFERESTNPPELVLKLNKLGTENPTALEIAGLIEARAGKYDAALEAFDRAAGAYQDLPEEFRCALHRADLLQVLGRDGELAELIKKVSSRFPDSVSKHILRSYRHSHP